jgi:tRNA A-37 threonylcarbamoyl transferase component Bud32
MGFRPLRLRRFRLWTDPRLPDAWVESVIGALPQGPRRGHLQAPLPEPWVSRVAVVKVYNRRPSHRLLRRLRPGKAVREASGMRVFARAGVPVPPLLAWGEERALGLWQRGVVITERLPATALDEQYQGTRHGEVFAAGMERLAMIHRAGLAHGDARACNFLADGDDVFVIDVEAWSRLNRRSGRRDLVRYLGSALRATGDAETTSALLARYEALAGAPVARRASLLEEARRYALEEAALLGAQR